MEYKIGDTALIRAKVEDVDFDEYGQTCIVSLPWGELKAMDPEELVAEKAAKAVEKTEKASGNPEKSSKNGRKRQKTAENGKEKQQGSTEGVKATERQQDSAKRQQERKRPGRPSKKAVGESEGTTTAAGLKELAKELADSTK